MTDKELQQLLDETARDLGVVGAQLAIYDGQHVREFTTGFRNLSLALAVTPGTLFQIGSVTKVFNAAMIVSLVQSGHMNLDEPVREYIPDLRLADVDAQQAITLRQLLSMSAGLDNGPYYDFGRGDDALGRYVEMLAGIPQVFKPGTAFGYSNAGCVIAGHAAARVMGQSWEDLLSERIWAPLGLKQSALFAEELLLHPVALGYRKPLAGGSTELVRPWSLPRSMGPSGALTCSSAGDLIRLARMFLDQGKSPEGVQILSEKAVKAMQQLQVKVPTRVIADAWCTGIYQKTWGNHVLYGHSGTNDGGSSMLLWCPEKNMAIATVVNVAAQGYPMADVIFDSVLRQMFDIKKPGNVTPQNAAPVATELAPYVGRFEAFGVTQSFAVEHDKLRLTSRSTVAAHQDVSGCELISLGEGRFLPVDSRVSGNRNWDMAFWGGDATGRPTHLLQGVFPLRRTG